MTDFYELHNVLDEMKTKEADIVHSINNQITYVQGVAQNSKINADAVIKLVNHCKKRNGSIT
jgi:DNA-binding ferritin-like protein